MRQLHVLGVSDDGTTLLLGTSKNGGKPTHRVPVDERLRAAARGQLVVSNGDRAESALSPKEIQARMRAGATPEEVAKAAGVPVARVLPYFAPVEAERDRIVDEARACAMHRHRGPDSVRPLGEVVDAHLAEVTGLKDESVDWTARRRNDGAWVVSVTYAARGGRRKAEWLWKPLGKDLSPLDAAAARLGADGTATGGTRRATKAPARKPAARKPASRRAKPAARKAPPRKKAAPVKKAAAKKAAPVKRAVVKKAAPVKKAVVKKAAPVRKPAAKKAAPVKRAVARKPVVTKATAKKAVVKKAIVKKAVVKKAAPARLPVAAKRPAKKPVVRQTPPPPPVVEIAPTVIEIVPDRMPEPEPAPTPEPAPAATRRPGQRVPLPSWSDVLLGVTGNRDEAARSATPPPPERSRSGRRRAG